MIFDFFREKLATFGPFFPDFPISQISREFPGLAKMGLGFPGLKKRGKYSTLHYTVILALKKSGGVKKRRFGEEGTLCQSFTS